MIKNQNIVAITIAFIAFVLLTMGRALLSPYIFALSAVPGIALDMIAWWITLIPVLLLMKWDKTRLSELGLVKEKLLVQIALGLTVGIVLSAVIIGTFCLLGVLNFMMGNGNMSVLSLFLQGLINIITVGFVEEFVFRGYIFKKLLDYKNARLFAIIVSSVLFGFFHFVNLFHTNISITLIQVGMTTFFGLIYCLFREKIKHFHLISLIVLHGVYDAALPFFTAVFNR